METIASDNNIVGYHPEDHVICRTHGEYLIGKGFTFAPEAVAYQFAKEGLNVKCTNEFGFHNADISNWRIDDYADHKLHARYIDLFYQLFPHAKRELPPPATALPL